ncbi:MAG: hypothetical protein ABH878_00700, partial [bacterium]
MTSIPIQFRYQEYQERRTELLWLSDTCAVLTGCKLSLQSNGEFMEYLADAGDTTVVPRYLNNGHQWGAHVHADIHLGPHNWLYVGGNCSEDTARMVWDDNIALMLQFITPVQNNMMSSQAPNDFPLKYQFMVDYGFEMTGGGPTEGFMNYFAHLPWNPSRPSPNDFLIEDPFQRDFFQVPHYPQIGEVGMHGPPQGRAFFDLTLEGIQVEFLKLYLEWLRHDRLADDDRVWLFGFNTHGYINNQNRDTILAFLQWLNDNFVGHISPRGNLIAQYTSFNEVRDAFYAWEDAHYGESSFSYAPGEPYPYSYPFLVNLLAYNHYVSDIPNWLAQGIHAHALVDTNETPQWVLWKDAGAAIIDFSTIFSDSMLSHDPVTGTAVQISPTAVPVGEEPLVLTPAPEPPQSALAYKNSRFGIFATHAPEFDYFQQQMGFDDSEFWQWASSHVQQLNAHWTRSNLQLVWDFCQPEIGGPFNWNNEFLTDSVLVNVYQPGNELNWLGVFHAGGVGLRNPLDYPDEYRDFLRAAVERFDGDSVAAVNPFVQVKWWQLGNEVGDWINSGRTARDYVRWVMLCEDAIRDADPNAKIALIAPTQAENPDPFLVEALRLAAGRVPFDAIDLHSWGSIADWQMDAVPLYRRYLDRLGLPEVQIWSCENGTWAYDPTLEPFQSPLEQARFLIKRYAANLSIGLDKLFWNNLMEWYNFGGDPGSIFNCMGLIGDGAGCGEPSNLINVPRPAYQSYQALSDFLDIPTEVLGLDEAYTVPHLQYSYLFHKSEEPDPLRVMWREFGTAPTPLNLGVNRALITPLIPDSSGQMPPPYYVFADSAGIIPIWLSMNPRHRRS